MAGSPNPTVLLKADHIRVLNGLVIGIVLHCKSSSQVMRTINNTNFLHLGTVLSVILGLHGLLL